MIDLAAVRADTPAAQRGVFLDSAGSSLAPEPVLAEQFAHLRREAEIGGYQAADERAGDFEAGYQVFAELLGCRAEEVAFTESATRSWVTAFQAVPLGKGDRVLVGEVEYASNAIPLLMRAEAVGASVEVVPSDEQGSFSAAALEEMLDERVKLVSVVHVPTNGGVVAEVRRISEAAHRVGALVLLDACQAIGQLDLDTDALDVDLVTATGRKWLRAPRGTGVLVVRDRAAERLRPPVADLRGAEWTAPHSYRLRDDARVHELWEHGAAARLGLIRAARYLLELGPAEVEQAVTARAAHLRAGLAELPGVTVRDLGGRKSGIVTFTVDGLPAAQVRDLLAAQGITVSVSHRPSALLDMTNRSLDTVVRASPHYFVTEEQLDATVAAVAALRRAA
ncbi:aminotransferase [Streptomyces tateyamensis]|uniref:Aminotransferase n=1 Tax=Streptomyces tateyamensis TaxID=565073 RepID=A0A2V4PN28_9ACTN|nr:aminotransferase class V-fold PLP-dependent enzyme [Streptomyces tateyamensis]PYC87646.1 aminotransferase [Streptomyces tateyamensis]